jgi:SIT4 phosphatase-associated protein
MLRLFASRIQDFQKLLVKPKSVPSSITTTFGPIEPLGFERFRICELYAELLHCSNMILLNDPRGEQVVKERDEERERLRREGEAKPAKPDLWGNVDLNRGKEWVVSGASSEGVIIVDPKRDPSDGLGKVQPPSDQSHVSTAARPDSSFATSNQSSEAPDSQSLTEAKSGSRGSSHGATDDKEVDLGEHDLLPDTTRKSDSADGVSTPVNPDGVILSPDPIRKPVVGDYLKMQFVEAKVLPAVVDLFFAHPWNNFLHNVVYDILTQVLNGPMDHGFNRQLVVDLFTTGQLTEKILQGQIASDEAQ